MKKSSVFDTGLARRVFVAQHEKNQLVIMLAREIFEMKMWRDMDCSERAICVHAWVVSSHSRPQFESKLISAGLSLTECVISWEAYPDTEVGANDLLMHQMFGGPVSASGHLVGFSLRE